MRSRLRQFRERFPTLNNLYEWVRGRKFPVFLEFPVRPRPRWGYATPECQPIRAYLDRYVNRYEATLRAMQVYAADFAAIPRRAGPAGPAGPVWDNGTLPALDAMALYAFLVRLNPKRYVEIGSGNSTRFARHVVQRHGLDTRITSIDPRPRVEVEALCDTRIAGLLEDQPLDLFTGLVPGDIVFFDGSHFSFQNSDTVVFFLDILPRLPPGVYVQIHDINWPLDYPPGVVDRYFSEQYVLAAYLLGGGARVEPELAATYAARHPTLAPLLDELFAIPPLQAEPRAGASFWFRLT